jgi:hypothetical protein
MATKTLSQNKNKEFWKAGAEAMGCPYGVCSAVMVKRETYERLGTFIAASLSPDVEMWARIASSYDIGFINSPTVIYHVNSASTGPQSLVNRKVSEIKADWDNLNEKISKNYPTKELQEKFLEQVYRLAPYSYWEVTKANIRAHNLINTLQSLSLIIFTYRGTIPLIRIVLKIIGKNIKIAFKKILALESRN